MATHVRFSSNHPTFLEYKYVKALFDYARVHDVLLRASPDHRGLDFGEGDLEELRVAADDLLASVVASVVSAWDALVEAKLRTAEIPPMAAGKRLSVKNRLKLLGARDSASATAIEHAWSTRMTFLNEARNEYQHEGYWQNSVGVGQRGGPFEADLIASTNTAEHVFVLRDCRRALNTLFVLNKDLGLRDPLPSPVHPCVSCFGDDLLGQSS